MQAQQPQPRYRVHKIGKVWSVCDHCQEGAPSVSDHDTRTQARATCLERNRQCGGTFVGLFERAP